MRKNLFLTILFIAVCAFVEVQAQSEEIFRNRILGSWKWEKGYLCDVGIVEPAPDSLGKIKGKSASYTVVFYPDQTIERFRNDTLIKRSKYTINKVKTYPTKVAFRLKSELFKGEALVTYFFNDELIISNCVWEDFEVRRSFLLF